MIQYSCGDLIIFGAASGAFEELVTLGALAFCDMADSE